MYIDNNNSHLVNNMVFLFSGGTFHAKPTPSDGCSNFLQYLGDDEEGPIRHRDHYGPEMFASSHNHWFYSGYDARILLSFVPDITKLRSRQIKRARKALRRKEARKNG